MDILSLDGWGRLSWHKAQGMSRKDEMQENGPIISQGTVPVTSEFHGVHHGETTSAQSSPLAYSCDTTQPLPGLYVVLEAAVLPVLGPRSR